MKDDIQRLVEQYLDDGTARDVESVVVDADGGTHYPRNAENLDDVDPGFVLVDVEKEAVEDVVSSLVEAGARHADTTSFADGETLIFRTEQPES